MNSELLQDIQERLIRIEKKIDEIDKGCVKMSNHVNFVEHVYSILRRPLSLLTRTPLAQPSIKYQYIENE